MFSPCWCVVGFSRGGKAVRLTIDHKASLPEEAKRITDAGGFIGRNKRVNGVLAISRALGDHMLKENDVVSAEPFCSDTELTPEDTHILLACGQHTNSSSSNGADSAGNTCHASVHSPRPVLCAARCSSDYLDGVWDVMSDQEAIDFMRSKLVHYEALYSEWKQQHSNGTDAVGYDTDDGGKAGSGESKAADDDDSPMHGADEQRGAHHDGASNGNTLSMQSTGMGGHHSAAAAVDGLESPRNLNEVLSLTAKALVKEALDRRSLDNVTVMIIAL